MEREGKASERGDERRSVWERNRLREELRREADVIDLAIEREKREREEAAESARRAQEEQYRGAVGKKERVERPDQERRREEARRREEQARRAERERTAEERETAYQKGRFEAWANRRRAELQDRQLDDRGDLGRRHHQQRTNLDASLGATYGPGIQDANRRLAEIEAREKAGRVARFVYRLSGRARRDHGDADAARANLADIYGRMGEQRGKLERSQGTDREALETAHRRQSSMLEERIAAAYERREREGWRPLPEREAANDRQRQQEGVAESAREAAQRQRAERRGARDNGYG